MGSTTNGVWRMLEQRRGAHSVSLNMTALASLDDKGGTSPREAAYTAAELAQ